MITIAVVGGVLVFVLTATVLLIDRADKLGREKERAKHAERAIEAQKKYNEVLSRPAPSSDAERVDRWSNI